MPRPKRYATIIAYTAEALKQVEAAASVVLQDKVIIRCNDNDRLRLYNLTIWSEKYKVPLSFIMAELLTYWLGKFRTKRRKGTLGVRITTLTSKGSKSLILSKIKELYPQGEHLTQWTKEREKALTNLQDQEFVCTNVAAIASEYKQFISDARTQLAENRTKYRKPFRGSPFTH